MYKTFVFFKKTPRVPTGIFGRIVTQVQHGQGHSCFGAEGLVYNDSANSTQGWYIIFATSTETHYRQAFQHFWLGDLALNTHTDACTWSPGCLYSCPSVGMALRQLTR